MFKARVLAILRAGFSLSSLLRIEIAIRETIKDKKEKGLFVNKLSPMIELNGTSAEINIDRKQTAVVIPSV